ncbi:MULTISPECIES: methyltransferase domain-containing protein [unclassified Roseobacter]|uniref:methyltransferase domain-containing protein n=1 Tax=unclassified Roseobacter TaxID=196798 RepID=UPI001C0F2E95|nr:MULTISPECIES: methyltransferase domain-containing protein [unclassified Roseobacter]
MVDRATLARRRARARLDQAGFLHDEAKFELQERLIDVNRSFTTPAIVTPFREIWADFLPGATLVADKETLDIAPGAHDLVIHAMGLHWANDPVGQIVQCRRALKPDGLFLAVFFAGDTLAELRAAIGQAEIETLGGLSPRIAPMGELRDLGGLLQRAGFALPVADSTRRDVSYADLPSLMADLRVMGETNALATRHRRPTPRRLFTRAAEIYAESFPAENGRIRATFELAFLTGWSPHDSQQKPLRPGSATSRLADALKTTEFDETAMPVQTRDQE